MKTLLLGTTLVLAMAAGSAAEAKGKAPACRPQSLVGDWACDASCKDHPGKIATIRSGAPKHRYLLKNAEGEVSGADVVEKGKLMLAWDWHTGKGKGPSVAGVSNCARTITWVGGVRWTKVAPPHHKAH